MLCARLYFKYVAVCPALKMSQVLWCLGMRFGYGSMVISFVADVFMEGHFTLTWLPYQTIVLKHIF